MSTEKSNYVDYSKKFSYVEGQYNPYHTSKVEGKYAVPTDIMLNDTILYTKGEIPPFIYMFSYDSYLESPENLKKWNTNPLVNGRQHYTNVEIAMQRKAVKQLTWESTNPSIAEDEKEMLKAELADARDLRHIMECINRGLLPLAVTVSEKVAQVQLQEDKIVNESNLLTDTKENKKRSQTNVK